MQIFISLLDGAPYVDQFNLRGKYDNVHIANICEFDISDYDFIILGDVLEHLSTEDAQHLIDDIFFSEKQCLVAIPYMMAQDGEEYENQYETHLQPDLTPEVMMVRYPQLVKLYNNERYGYYAMEDSRWEKAYVLYATESYKDTVQACVDSIKEVSDTPIIVYMLNSDVDIKGAVTIKWECNVDNPEQNKYINRASSDIYKILIQRPAIVKDALKYATTVAYVDSDSVGSSFWTSRSPTGISPFTIPLAARAACCPSARNTCWTRAATPEEKERVEKFLTVHGQELSPTNYAVCRADLLIKNDRQAKVAYGNSLIPHDPHSKEPGDQWPEGKYSFNRMLRNPPFGVTWGGKDGYEAEARKLEKTRYRAGSGLADRQRLHHIVALSTVLTPFRNSVELI